MTATLDTLDYVDPGQLARLHSALEDAAVRTGVLDAAYRFVDSPVGSLMVVSTERGIVRVAFEREGYDVVLDSLSTRLGSRVLKSTIQRGPGAALNAAAKEFEEYFSGKRTVFDLQLDLSLSKGFRREVLEHLRVIPYGQTESYTEVATASGSPRAVRAVGSACATNPLPVIVPCHRVLRSDGSLGGYLGGLEAKRALLNLESVA